jgi:hypothetical protein
MEGALHIFKEGIGLTQRRRTWLGVSVALPFHVNSERKSKDRPVVDC